MLKMLKIFKKKETKKVWKVAYDDAVIHYGSVVKVFDDYNDAVAYKNEMEKNDKTVEWFVF
jgi:hypothetical protein